jgi:DNA polymerase III delta prime subunit
MRQALETYLKQERPRSFKEILGHERWFETLMSSLKRERATHSHQPVAFIGSPGVGKRTLAKLYAKALLCEQELDVRIDAAPCGVCDECRAIEKSSFAYFEKDASGDHEDEDGVGAPEKMQGEVLHTLIERDGGLNTASVRVVVFDNAEEFTGTTADIALKTLEQEGKSSLYVFLVNDEARFSAALRSRCSVYQVGPATVKDLVNRLSVLCEQRSVGFDEAAVRAVAVAASGSFGEAIAILARVERHGNVTVDNLIREPEFGWGPTMLACWRAVLGGRRDEAMSLFGDIGTDGSMRTAAMQAFLVECRIRHVTNGLPTGASASPALDFIADEAWESILRDWAEWSRERGIELDEALEQALAFWASVRIGLPWRASFLRGYEALTGDRTIGGLEMASGI